MLFALFILFLSCGYGLAATVADFQNWTPDRIYGITYCDPVRGSGQVGGISCGAASYFKMKSKQPGVVVVNLTDTSLGLLNILTIAKAAYNTEREFYQTCKNYFYRLYDGLYKDISGKMCISAFPTPDGIDPACNDSSNVIIKSGSGYCMSEQVCGANIPVTFLADARDPTSVTYLWGNAVGVAKATLQMKEVGRCYAYQLRDHQDPIDTTIIAN